MRLYILFFLTSIILEPCFGQNAGYAGKHLLGKIDVLEGKKSFLSGIEIEGIMNRHLTLTLGYKNFKQKTNQYYSSGEYTLDGLSDIPSDADVHTTSLGIGIRYYFNNDLSIPAPDGFFCALNLLYGQYNVVDGTYDRLLLQTSEDQGYFNSYTTLVDYTYNNINFYSIGFGIGLQKLLNQWLTIGGIFSFVSTKTILDNKGYTEKVISGVAKNYGSNAYTFQPLDESQSTPYNKSNGLSITIQIGAIIF